MSDGMASFSTSQQSKFRTLTSEYRANVGVFTGGVVKDKIYNHAEHIS